jgi:hypothetical protein
MDALVNVAENHKKKLSDSSVLSQLNMAVMLEKDQFEDLKAGKIYRYDINDKVYHVVDGFFTKIAFGPDYNFIFDKRNGDFKRWGTSFEDDPLFSPIGPEILDLEISVNGCSNGCNFCSPAGTQVNTECGSINIEEVQVGDSVLGMSKDGRIEPQEVAAVYEREYKGDIIEISLENGKTLRLTPEHPVILVGGIEKNAGDLTDDDDEIIGTMDVLTEGGLECLTRKSFAESVES